MGFFKRFQKEGQAESKFPGKRLDIDGILALDSPTSMIIELSYGLSDKIGRSGYQSLSHAEKVLNAVYWLEAEVNNGGFDQYFLNSSGDYAVDTPAALEEIGAHRTAEIVVGANSSFPGGSPPRDRNQRLDLYDRVTDEIREKWTELDKRFYQYEDPLEQLQIDYMKSKREEIILLV